MFVVVVYHFITLIVDERREQTIVNQVELIVLKSFLISGCGDKRPHSALRGILIVTNEF